MLNNDYDTCVVWTLMNNSSLTVYDYPNNYPMTNELSNTKMRPKEVTFKLLIDTLDTAGDNMRKI